MTNKKTIADKVKDRLDVIEIGKGIDKKDLAERFYVTNDYFTMRTLDVHICKAKKMLPDKSFKSIRCVLTRTK